MAVAARIATVRHILDHSHPLTGQAPPGRGMGEVDPLTFGKVPSGHPTGTVAPSMKSIPIGVVARHAILQMGRRPPPPAAGGTVPHGPPMASSIPLVSPGASWDIPSALG